MYIMGFYMQWFHSHPLFMKNKNLLIILLLSGEDEEPVGVGGVFYAVK